MVNLLLRLDSSATLFRNGTGGDIAGYNIVSASSTSDPGPNASDYSLRSFVSAPGGAAGTGSATVDCANASKNEWIAFQLVSAIGGPSPAVGPRVRVTCDPALANPKYNLVPKRGMGTGISD